MKSAKSSKPWRNVPGAMMYGWSLYSGRLAKEINAISRQLVDMLLLLRG